jgi:hypothetical protein
LVDGTPPHVAAKALSWHWLEFVQPPHLPLMQKSGAQSESCEHVRPHTPGLAPLHVWAPPQFSPDAQPHVPPVQMPLAQSVFWVQVAAWHVPPQRLPAPQSAAEAHALAVHLAPLQVPPVPQSAFEPQAAGGVHLAPEQVPVGQSESPLHVDVLHLAPLHTLPVTVHDASPAQLCVLHFMFLHAPLTMHDELPLHEIAEHVAPVQEPLIHAVSAPHDGAAPQVAPLHLRLTVQAASELHPVVGVVQVAPVQMPALVPQFVSRLHAPAVHKWVVVLHVPPVPHCEFFVQAPAVHTPFFEPLEPVPQELLSQLLFAWHVAPALAQVPFEPPPQFEPSQSPLAWHAWPVPFAQTPPEHAPPSHCELAWQVLPPVPHVPDPQELLSQSVFCVHAWPLVEQVPAVAPVPLPHVPPIPHAVFEWQAVPALHVPV